MSRLPPAPDLIWDDGGAPRARGFDDVYFSVRGGLAESEAVFLAGCGLPGAFEGRSRFAICELGFGTGLNTLAVWRAWTRARTPNAILHMCAVEAFPLERADAARALSAFPEIGEFAERLLARWPVRAYAPQRIWFEEDGFALTIIVDDAARALTGLSGCFDAWFLDGFAPSRNPDMWSPDLFARMRALSVPGARVATFSVAGAVRRGLEGAGFAVEKKPGFGAKRERLEARLSVPAPVSLGEGAGARASEHAPLGGGRSLLASLPLAPEMGPIAIIGAGIAGACVAQALGRRGVTCLVLDAGAEVGAGASGNPAGLVSPRFDRGEAALREVFLAAYLAAINEYDRTGVLTAYGIVQRPDARQGEAFADLAQDPPLPRDWFTPLADGAVLHPRAGLTRPRVTIEGALGQAEARFDVEVAAITRVDGGWRLSNEAGETIAEAARVVLACGAGLKRFAPDLPIEFSRGQLEWAALARDEAPWRPVMQRTYAAPFADGALFGATFDRVAEAGPQAPDEDSRRRNLDALAALAPELAGQVKRETLQSRASLRAALPDRAPVMGAIGEGLYVLGGLGARGLTLAPLLGECLASEMCGEPSILSQAALEAIHPRRFALRAKRRS